MTQVPVGIVPPTTTPFTADGDIDFKSLQTQIRFMKNAGVSGICVGGSTGEGHTLDAGDSRALWTASKEELGDLPLMAGIIVNSTKEAVHRCTIARESGATSLQVTAPHYLFRPDDDAMVEHFRAIAESSGLPVIIYNVIPWSYLYPELLLRIMNEVPGVVGVKQSNGDLKLIADLLLDMPSGKVLYSAMDALLYPSFTLGVSGTIAATPAAVPGWCIRLWDAVKRGDHATAKQVHHNLLRLWNVIAGNNLPAYVKYVQELQGVQVGYPRAPMRMPDDLTKARIREAFEAGEKGEAAAA
jgi:4-hydroxy-tetrahydrodipicolinate synthase